jgi:hypothetical protein
VFEAVFAVGNWIHFFVLAGRLEQAAITNNAIIA